MGSLPDSTRGLLGDGMGMDEVAKADLGNPEGSCSDSVSTPEPDGEVTVQEASQRQKRKGGRKPIYATSEERKQRNRQAQAAFRERRTEYIKQLENTIKHNEETLQSLQQSHRNAADECLMLRYKNSLLERILLEKGIDVQAELQLKNGSPSMPPDKPTTPGSPLSRPPMGHQPPSRPQEGGPTIDAARAQQGYTYNVQSPQLQPTPSSHVSSPPATKSPGFVPLQGAMSSPSAEFHSRPQHQPPPPPPPPQQQQPQLQPQQTNIGQYQGPQMGPHRGSFNAGAPAMTPASTTDTADHNGPARSLSSDSPLNPPRMSQTYYMHPYHQKSYDQIDQEYNPQPQPRPDTVGDPGPDESPETNTYQPYRSQSLPRGPQGDNQGNNVNVPAQFAETPNNTFEHFDPMMDADPFGLTASMHFETPFSYAQNQNRQ